MEGESHYVAGKQSFNNTIVSMQDHFSEKWSRMRQSSNGHFQLYIK